MNKNVIGLDIGGTKINGILFDGKKVLKELTIVTPDNLYQFESSLLKLVDFLSIGKKITGIGVGMAGLIDSEKGIAIHSPNIKFVKNLNLEKFFGLNGFKDSKIDNDANCFTRAELYLGQGKTLNNFIALTLGTGIGGGIVINRQIYRGEGNLGAELGHIVTKGAFLEKEFQKARDKRNDHELGVMLGQSFASFINIFSPQAIILGGGVATDKTRHFLPIAEKEIKKFLFSPKAKTKIVVSKLKNAGALGAALSAK
jgi:glucokinase